MARTLIGQVELRLKDLLTERAKKAAEALRSVNRAAEALGTGPRLNVLSGSFLAIAREAQSLKAALAGVQVPAAAAADIRRLASSGRNLSRLTADVNALAAAMRGLGSGITGNLGLDRIRSEIAALRAEIRRFNAMPAGGGGGGPRGPSLRPGPPGSPGLPDGLRPPFLRPGLPGVPGGSTTAQVLGYPGAGPALNRVGRTGIGVGFDLQRQNTLDYQAGLDRGESQEVRRLAIQQSRRRMQIDATTLHEVFREAMIGMGGRAGGGMGKLQDLAPDVADGITQMMTRYGPERAVEQFRAFFRGADVLDRNDRADVMRELLHGFTRAQGVEGAEFNYRDLYNAARYSKSAGQALSNRFLYTELPVIMGDVGGSRAGTELGSLYAQLIGDRASRAAKAQQRQFGIRDDNGVIGREMLSDPGEWARKVLMPGLQRNGVDINDPRQVVEAVNKVVSNQIVAAMLARAITQRERIRERQKQYDLAPSGPEGADTVERMDGRMALEALLAQVRNLLGAGFDPILEEFRGPMRNLATTLNEWAEQVRASPQEVVAKFKELAGTIGGIVLALGGLKLASIVAMGAAGPALLHSAGALTAAAAALRASGVPRGLPLPPTGPVPPGSLATPGNVAAGGGLMATLARVLPGVGAVVAGAGLGYGATRAINEWGNIANGKYWTPENQEEIDGYKARIAELQERLAGIDRRTHPSMRDAPNPERSTVEEEIRHLQNKVEAGERRQREAEQRRSKDDGYETGGSFGQQRPEDRGHETGEAFSANVAQGVAAGSHNVLQQMDTLMQQLRAKAADGVQINIRATTIPGTAPTGSMGGEAPGRALGGPVSAGRFYTVGEAGPELFQPGANGSIIPNHALPGLAGAADGHSGGPRQRDSRTVSVTLSGPLIGSINAASMSVDEMKQAIEKGLADQISSSLRGIFADI